MSQWYRAFRLCIPLLVCTVGFDASSLYAWSPGTDSPIASNGFVVDTMDRSDVLSFYNCIYNASENYAATIGWTGSVAGRSAGVTTAAFKNDVLRRINFYRALTGLPGDISFDSVKSTKAQQAALMMSRNNSANHFPPTSWSCYTVDGAQAAGKSNLTLGVYGPSAIDSYMSDPGVGNEIVGHRRWLLYSYAQSMGTGDIPGESSYQSSNTLWVLGDFKTSTPAQFAAWPNSGYCPFPLMPKRWSLSYRGAGFASAVVTMKVAGVAVATSIISKTDNGYGDNTLVWTATGLPTSITADVPCTVTVSGITGSGIPTTFSYDVILFDPNFLGDAVTIAGLTTPPTAGTIYTFNQIQQADAYELRVSQTDASSWTEGAESSPTPRIQQNTTGTYALRQSGLKRSGAQAFHLLTPTPVDQSFTITRDIILSANSNLQWYDLARFTITTCTLSAEISIDTGATWTSVFSRNGVGHTSSLLWDLSWRSRSVSLAAYAGKTVRVRFIMRTPSSGSYLGDVSGNSGFFIDDVTVTNATQLGPTTTTALSSNANSFTLNAATAGAPLLIGKTYLLRARPLIGNRWFGDGPLKAVTAIATPTGYDGWFLTKYPTVTEGVNGDHDGDGISNGVEYAFGLNPQLSNSASVLPQPVKAGNNYSVTYTAPLGITNITYGVRWSPDLETWYDVPDTGSGNIHTFSIDVTGEPQVFFSHRVVIGP